MDKLEYIPGDLVKFATNTYTIVNFEENFLHNKICYALISTNSTKNSFCCGQRYITNSSHSRDSREEWMEDTKQMVLLLRCSRRVYFLYWDRL